MITRDEIDLIKEKANDEIESILDSLDIDIEKNTGYNGEIRMPCFLHDGDNATAWAYNTNYNSWRCFTAHCEQKYGSDIIGLVRGILSKDKDEPISFVQAVQWLAKFLNIDINNNNQHINQNDKELRNLIKENNIKKQLGQNKEATKDNFKAFPFDLIKNKIEPSIYLQKRNFSKDILIKYGVSDCLVEGKPLYNRCCFPVLSEDGKTVIGVSGRILYEKCDLCGTFHNGKNLGCPNDNPKVRSYPKWIHYGFLSSNVLYNLSFAQDSIKNTGTVILTEGPKEVVYAAQYGINNIICLFGLNTYQYHIKKLLSLGCRTVVVCLDHDERGIEAAEKLDERLGPYFKIVNIQHLLKPNQDLDELDREHIDKIVKPFLKSLYI